MWTWWRLPRRRLEEGWLQSQETAARFPAAFDFLAPSPCAPPQQHDGGELPRHPLFGISPRQVNGPCKQVHGGTIRRRLKQSVPPTPPFPALSANLCLTSLGPEGI